MWSHPQIYLTAGLGTRLKCIKLFYMLLIAPVLFNLPTDLSWMGDWPLNNKVSGALTYGKVLGMSPQASNQYGDGRRSVTDSCLIKPALFFRSTYHLQYQH